VAKNCSGVAYVLKASLENMAPMYVLEGVQK